MIIFTPDKKPNEDTPSYLKGKTTMTASEVHQGFMDVIQDDVKGQITPFDAFINMGEK